MASLQKLLVYVLSALILLPAPALAQNAGNDLPDIGSPASSALTIDDEYRIGLQVVRQLRDEGQIIEDPEATEYLNALGSRHEHVPALLRIRREHSAHRIGHQALGQVARGGVRGADDRALAQLSKSATGEREELGVRQRRPVHRAPPGAHGRISTSLFREANSSLYARRMTVPSAACSVIS